MIDDPLNRTKVKRGTELPQSKLTEDEVRQIWALVAEREKLRKRLSNLTNKAIADRFGVHVRTIEHILYEGAWSHVVPQDECYDAEED